MKHWTDLIRCPYCGEPVEIYDRYFIGDDDIRVTCYNCGFRQWFKDMEDIKLFFFPSGITSTKNNIPTDRSRAWRRHKNFTKALRKRNITKNYWSSQLHPYYDNLHQYSKNKIHCSCPMCSPKTRNKGRRNRKNYNPSINYKPSDRRRQETMDQSEEYYKCELDE